MELFEIRIGRDLIELFRNGTPTELLQLIPRLRCKLAEENVGMPIVRIRDSPKLQGDEYQILIRERVVGVGQVNSGRVGEARGSSSQPLHDAIEILAQLEQIVRRHVNEFEALNDPVSDSAQVVVVN